MSPCHHTSWLSFHKETAVSFRRTSGLSDIVAGLEDAEHKWPCLVLLTGTADGESISDRIIQKARRRPDRQEPRGATLQLDTVTAASDYPLLIVNTSGYRPFESPLSYDEPVCHRSTVSELAWLEEDAKETQQSLTRRFIYPFLDVICFYSGEELDKGQLVQDLAACWELDRALPGFSPSRPSFLLILRTGDVLLQEMVRRDILEALRRLPVSPDEDFLARISVQAEQGSRTTLRARIFSEADQSRERRSCNSTLLNAIHLDHLVQRAYDHFVASGNDPFNPLIASRLHRPVPANLQIRISEVLTSFKSNTKMKDLVGPYIAECLLQDSYTPDVHSKYTFADARGKH
jgi:hypothetical protein